MHAFQPRLPYKRLRKSNKNAAKKFFAAFLFSKVHKAKNRFKISTLEASGGLCNRREKAQFKINT